MADKPKRGGVRTRTTRGCLRARVWWCLRKNGRQTIRDIMNTQCTGEEKDAESNIGRFLERLVRAGVVEVDLFRQFDGVSTSNGLNVYVLVRDLGPACPVMREKTKTLYDPNSGTEIECNRPLVPNKAKPPAVGGKGGDCLESEGNGNE